MDGRFLLRACPSAPKSETAEDAWGLEISLHHADHDLTSRITCAAGPVLLSVDDPLVTLEHRMRANIGRIRRSDIGLGHTKAGTNLAVHEWLKPLFLLSLSPVFVDDFHVARVGCTS